MKSRILTDQDDAAKRYTVLLLRPDYVADDYGSETYLARVTACSAQVAVVKAQKEVAKVDDLGDSWSSADYYPLITLDGWHDDVTPGEYR